MKNRKRDSLMAPTTMVIDSKCSSSCQNGAGVSSQRGQKALRERTGPGWTNQLCHLGDRENQVFMFSVRNSGNLGEHALYLLCCAA